MKKKSARPQTKSKSAKKSNRPTRTVALKGTVSKAPRKAELRHMPWKSVALEALNPRLGRKLIVGKDIMLARIFLAKGCIVPKHSHPNEQLTYILQGALKFWIAGKEIVVRAGEVLTIPPNMPHKAKALEHTDDLDIFTPPRADWMRGTDSYLR